VDADDVRIILRQCEDIIDEAGHFIRMGNYAKFGFYIEIDGPCQYNVHYGTSHQGLYIARVVANEEISELHVDRENYFSVHDPECFEKFKIAIDKIATL
jgi:Cys-tRNA synthase (O-phospho-L-seryl-tRNA:Cys-tRNA synthase)